MPIFAGRRRGRRWCTRGVGGALNRWPAPDLGAALCLHPVRTQGVGSTAVVPIAHSRSLIEHLQVKGHSLRWSPLPVCRCSFYLLFLTFSCLQVEIMPSCPPSEKCFFFLSKMKCRSSYMGSERSCDRTEESCRCRCMTRRSRVRTEGRDGETSRSFLPKLAWRCIRRAL